MRKLLMFVAAIATFGACAETAKVGGYTWTYLVTDEGSAVIMPADDTVWPYVICVSPEPSGALSIPSTLGGKPVVGIGGNAFYGCDGLTGVTIPNGVEYIDSFAFAYSGIKSVSIPGDATYYAHWTAAH